jgi:Fusaric acid resistance protein family
MLAMRMLPPMQPAKRARRLLALTLRDLRRLTRGSVPASSTDWEGKVYSRLTAISDSVDPLQAARMVAALSLGKGIIRLRRIARRFALDAELSEAMDAIAAGDSVGGISGLDRFDRALLALPPALPGAGLRMRARSTILSTADPARQLFRCESASMRHTELVSDHKGHLLWQLCYMHGANGVASSSG